MPCAHPPALLRIVRAPLPAEAREAAVAVRGPEDVAGVVVPLLRDEPSEVMLVVLLTAKHRVVGVSVVGRGGIDHVPCEPREVFKTAILANAAAVILAHNHPSGDPEPSGADLDVTQRIEDAGRLLGIPLLDHLIVGDGRFVSMHDLGHLTDRSTKGGEAASA